MIDSSPATVKVYVETPASCSLPGAYASHQTYVRKVIT